MISPLEMRISQKDAIVSDGATISDISSPVSIRISTKSKIKRGKEKPTMERALNIPQDSKYGSIVNRMRLKHELTDNMNYMRNI